MKIDNFSVTATGGNSDGRENAEMRSKRMKAYFTNKDNAKIYVIGKILSHVVNGKSVAAHLLAGEKIELTSVQSNGRNLPLTPGYVLSLDTLKTVWGCPVCKSAHGTGESPSPKKDVELLEGCKFYYNPVTRNLFTISASCWSNWVKGLNFTRNFVETPAVESAVPTKDTK